MRWYRHGQSEDWRHATALVSARGDADAGVLFYPPYLRMPVALYVDEEHLGTRAPRPVYPSAPFGPDEIRYDRYVPVTADAVAAGARRFRRVWLVVSHVALYGGADPGYDAARKGLARAGFVAHGTTRLDGITLLRYDRG